MSLTSSRTSQTPVSSPVKCRQKYIYIIGLMWRLRETIYVKCLVDSKQQKIVLYLTPPLTRIHKRIIDGFIYSFILFSPFFLFFVFYQIMKNSELKSREFWICPMGSAVIREFCPDQWHNKQKSWEVSVGSNIPGGLGEEK